MTLKIILCSSLLLLICGCSELQHKQAGSSSDYGMYPTNYVDVVHDWIRFNFRDPDSVKDLQVNEPFKYDWKLDYGIWGSGHTYGYLISFWCNARNAYGGYTGLENESLFVRDGQVLHVINSATESVQ